MPATAHADLTRSERRVLGLLLEGLVHHQAALRLGVALSTLRTHVRHLHAKCGTHSPVGLVLWGAEHRACCL